MTEDQRNLVRRYVAARLINPYGGLHDNPREDPEKVLQKLNESFDFEIKTHSEKVALVLEEAITSQRADDVWCALSLVGIIGFQPQFMSMFITLLKLPFHRSHEEIIDWFQYLKLPEPVEALYKMVLDEHLGREWDENYTLARKCTYALADIGTDKAYERLLQLSKCDTPMIAAFAQERIDSWEEEKSLKGT